MQLWPSKLKTNAENVPQVSENGLLCIYTMDGVAFLRHSSLEPVSVSQFSPENVVT